MLLRTWPPNERPIHGTQLHQVLLALGTRVRRSVRSLPVHRVASLTELDELLELVFRQTERHRERVAADTYLHRLRQRRGLWILGGLHLRQVDQKFDHIAQRGGILRS